MYIFSEFENLKRELVNKGIEIIDLSIGDPDHSTPQFIVNSLMDAVMDGSNHNYPPYRGTDEFKIAVAKYYEESFGVELDYRDEVAVLIGSKEGIAHLILGISDAGDYLIICDPCYPVYNSSAIISGCNIYKINLLEENGYLPIFDDINKRILEKTKMVIVNYPNNPTGAIANKDFYQKLISFGKQNDIVIANDGAYNEICSKEGNKVSILQVNGAKDISVEFGTLSKSYNMAGWRLGYVVGNRDVINQLMLIKTNFDSGQFSALQHAGAIALKEGKNTIIGLNKIYELRRKIIVDALRGIDLHVYDSKGTFYVWFKNPTNYTSLSFVSKFLKEQGVLITPGSAFGESGEGYCRISLTADEKNMKEVARRISLLELK